MNTLTDTLKKTSDSVSKGVGGVAKGIGKGLQEGGNVVEKGLGGLYGEAASGHRSGHGTSQKSSQSNVDPAKSFSKTTKDTSTAVSGAAHQPPDTKVNDGGGGLFTSLSSGATTVFAPTAGIAISGVTLIRDSAYAGVTIGQTVAKSGLDMGANVATGTAAMAGTALGGVVAAAAETSGAVFEPVGSGLKAIQGLEKLGEGVEMINGLSLGAIKQVNSLTTKALNMSGMAPTFFDTDGNGIVTVPDTVRGLVLLGLNEKNAKYAAYVLHGIFSYPTSERWLPALDTKLPIRVANMGRARWGKNWGNFERLDWVDDMEIDKLFLPQNEKTWSESIKDGRQFFGILLLIFEWGTTWPFYMPSVPVQQIPFSNEIGTVVRKAILPTIISNFKKAREANSDGKHDPGSKKPSVKAPVAAKGA